MIQVVYVIAILIIVASLGLYVGFVRSEGSDERGREILARSGMISFIFLCLGFAAQSLYFLYGNVSLDQVQLVISIWMAFVFGGNGVGILVYRQKL